MILVIITLTTLLIANMIGHGPAVALFGSIALIIGERMGIDFITAGFVTAAASSYSYLTVIGSPAATIVYSSGELETGHFLKAGLQLTVASMLLIFLIRYTYWMILP